MTISTKWLKGLFVDSEITDLFSVRISETDLTKHPDFEELQREIKDYISLLSLDLENPPTTWDDNFTSTFTYSENYAYKKCLVKLPLAKKIFEQKLRDYLYEAFDLVSTKPITIPQSWLNFNKKHNFQSPHHHGDSTVSGIYYHKTNTKDGDLKFINQNDYITSPLYVPSVNISPKVGKLVLFPSYLMHRVLFNKTDNLRISLAFNAQVHL